MNDANTPTYIERARRLARALTGEREPEIVDALSHFLRSLATTRPAMLRAALRGLPLGPLINGSTNDAERAHLSATSVWTASDLASVPPEQLDTWFMEQIRAFRSAARSADADELARRLRQRLRNRAQHDPESVGELAPVALQLGISEATSGHHVIAAADFRAAAKWATDTHADIASEANLRAAVVDAARGRLREAQRMLGTVSIPRSTSAPLSTEFLRTLATALLAVERMAPDAEHLLLRASLLEPEDDFWIFLTLGFARWEIANGGLSAALERIALARATHTPAPGTFADVVLLALRSNALIHLGEHAAADSELAAATVDDWADLRLARARVLLIEGHDDQARILLRGLIREEQVGPLIRTEALLLDLWRRHRVTGAPDLSIANTARVAIEREGLARVTTTIPRRLAQAVDADHHVVDVADLARRPTLRPSQKRVLVELAQGSSVAQIAAQLQLSVNTVRTHLKAAYRRLDSHSRVEAMEKARDLGLLDETP